jgi:hypothetical protein
MCTPLKKVWFAFTEIFLKGINRNSGGEKEKQGVGREIFVSKVQKIYQAM